MSKRTKKNLCILLIIAAVIAVIAVPQHISETVNSEMSISALCDNKPLYAAHRGLSALYPQNTIPAFEGAAKAGFYAFECDVHTTSDGEWVVIHNDTVDAMTDAEDEVESFTLSQLREMNIDAGNGIENYKNLKIPTLEETLSVCDEYDIVPIIEIKKCDVKYYQSFIELLEKHNLIDKVVIISFDFDYLVELQKYNSDIELMYLLRKVDKASVDKCIENGKIGIDFKYQNYILSASALRYAKENGLSLGAWTVDNTIASDFMNFIGVEFVTTIRILP